MKTASIQELKQELAHTSPAVVIECCLRLARLKKENKELLTYLLFEAHDEGAYLDTVKNDMDEQFAGINSANLYYAKKTIRKILRTTNRYIRFTGSAVAGVELLVHFCKKIRASGIPYEKSPALQNLYNGQLKKIKQGMDALHEDLRYDYEREFRLLET